MAVDVGKVDPRLPSREILQQREERARAAANQPTQISAKRLDPILEARRAAGEVDPSYAITMVFERFAEGTVGKESKFGKAGFIVGRQVDTSDGTVDEKETVVLLSGHLEYYLTREDEALGGIPVPLTPGDVVTLVYTGRGKAKTQFGERDDVARWSVTNLTTGVSSMDVGGFKLNPE